MKKKIALVVVVVILIIMQFISQPKNESTEILVTDITKVTDVSENVLMLLKTTCYDCHSNNTVYPWYSNIQPVAWWLNDHVKDGKKHLNFSDFGSYTTEKAKKKLAEIADLIEEDEMPLTSYTLIHRNAKLDEIQKKMIVVWAKNTAVTYGSGSSN